MDDLGDDELEKAAQPGYSSRYVVDEWCRRLAAEVKRRRRVDPPVVDYLAIANAAEAQALVKCPTCGADPRFPCLDDSGQRAGFYQGGERMGYAVHPERLAVVKEQR